MLRTFLVILTVMVSFAHAEEKSTKTTVKESAKEAGHAVGTATREVGHGTKTAAKEAGKAVTEAARETGHAFRDGAQEFKKAVKSESSSKGDAPPKK